MAMEKEIVETNEKKPIEIQMDPSVVTPSTKVKEIYCLHCRKLQPVKDVSFEVTSFNSKKKGVPMTRNTWKGTCATCGNSVRQFTKAQAELPVAQKPMSFTC